MSQKLKTQDLMEVFNMKLIEVNKKFDLDKKIISTVNKKLEVIKKSSVRIEFEPLGKVILENDKLFKDHWSELLNIFEKQISTMKVVSKSKERDQLYFYGALIVLLFLCTAFISYGIDEHYEKKDAERKLKFYSSETYRMNGYLKEKN